MKVYIIRHGETEWNRLWQLQGSADNPLNASGLREAMAASLYLRDIPFDHAYSSPLMRAKETCRIILRDRTCPIQVLDSITELDYGVYEGDDIKWIQTDEAHPVHWFFCQPERYVPINGGESLDHLQERCAAFVHDSLLPLEDTCRHLLVTAHGALIKGLMQYLGGRGNETFWEGNPSGNCAMTVLDCTDGVLSVECEGKDIVSEVDLKKNFIYL